MIRSVSMSLPRIGTAVPPTLMIFTISLMLPRSLVLARVDDLAVKRRRHHHGRAHQQRAPLRAALPANKVSIRRRRRDLASRELVGIHRQAHRAPGFAPLKSGFSENFVQAFLLSELLDFGRARHH